MDPVFIKRGPLKSEWEKRDSVAYSNDKEKEIRKIIKIPLSANRGRRFQFKQTFEISRPYSQIQPVKLANHSVRINWEIRYEVLSHTTTSVEKQPFFIAIFFLYLLGGRDGEFLP